MYSPTFGRWIQKDPAGYVDGANAYQLEVSNPTDELDPLGLAAEWKVVHQPGNSIALLDPTTGGMSKEFVKTYVNSDSWGLSDRKLAGGPPAPKHYEKCPAGGFRPIGNIVTRHDELVLSDQSADALRRRGIDIETLKSTIADFNQFAKEHEDRVVKALQDAWSPCGIGNDATEDSRRDAEFHKALDQIHLLDNLIQHLELIQIIAQAHLDVPASVLNRFLNDVDNLTNYLTEF